MELSGVIVGLVAVIGLLYLVPLYLSSREVEEDEVEDSPYTPSVQLVHDVEAADKAVAVSTPYMRSSLRYEVARRAKRSAGHRRRLALLFILATVVLIGTSIAGVTPWRNVAVAAGSLACYLVVARLATILQNRRYDAMLRHLNIADEEPTICFTLASSTNGRDVEISTPITMTGSLWDPVPVTAPTYVQQPLAPRTVRTIDLSAPESNPRREPVVAPPAMETDEEAQLPRAVGE